MEVCLAEGGLFPDSLAGWFVFIQRGPLILFIDYVFHACVPYRFVIIIVCYLLMYCY